MPPVILRQTDHGMRHHQSKPCWRTEVIDVTGGADLPCQGFRDPCRSFSLSYRQSCLKS